MHLYLCICVYIFVFPSFLCFSITNTTGGGAGVPVVQSSCLNGCRDIDDDNEDVGDDKKGDDEDGRLGIKCPQHTVPPNLTHFPTQLMLSPTKEQICLNMFYFTC